MRRTFLPKLSEVHLPARHYLRFQEELQLFRLVTLPATMYALAVEDGITLGRPGKKKGNIKNNSAKQFNNLLLQSTNSPESS